MFISDGALIYTSFSNVFKDYMHVCLKSLVCFLSPHNEAANDKSRRCVDRCTVGAFTASGRLLVSVVLCHRTSLILLSYACLFRLINKLRSEPTRVFRNILLVHNLKCFIFDKALNLIYSRTQENFIRILDIIAFLLYRSSVYLGHGDEHHGSLGPPAGSFHSLRCYY